MAVKASSYALTICCKKHPNYRGIRTPKKCGSCALLFLLIHGEGKGIDNLSGLKDVLAGLKVKSENTPSRLEFTTKAEKKRHEDFHYIGCPQYNLKPGQIAESCACAQMARE